jgi:hypothetical protein
MTSDECIFQNLPADGKRFLEFLLPKSHIGDNLFVTKEFYGNVSVMKMPRSQVLTAAVAYFNDFTISRLAFTRAMAPENTHGWKRRTASSRLGLRKICGKEYTEMILISSAKILTYAQVESTIFVFFLKINLQYTNEPS